MNGSGREAADGRGGNPPVEVPPWLFLWIPLFLWSLPDRLDTLRDQLANLLKAGSGLDPAVPAAAGAFVFRNLVVGSLVLEGLVWALLAAGIALVLLPRLRAWELERRYGLAPYDPAYPGAALHEIVARFREIAPGLEVRVNLAETRETAFVYPLGYRRNAVAVFGALTRAWRVDRAAAEVILLHELAHHRNGDALVVGAGSRLEVLLRHWWILLGVLAVLPVAWTVATFAYSGGAWGAALTNEYLPRGLVGGPLRLLLWTPAVLLPPLAALWVIEFQADRFAAAKASSPTAYIAWLGTHKPKPGLLNALTHKLSHPPLALRRWLLARAERPLSLVVVLLIFPASYLAAAALLVAWSFLLHHASGLDPAAYWRALPARLTVLAGGIGRTYLMIAAALAAWTLVQALRVQRDGPSPRRAVPLACTLGLGIVGYAALPPPHPAPPAATLDRTRYVPGETVTIRLTGTGGHPSGWVTVVPAESPADSWGVWSWFRDAAPSGITTRDAGPPGTYDVRLYTDGTTRQEVVGARLRFEVIHGARQEAR
ncbi:hypothetical protein [Falsiroseomonas sp.]|uniref:hypothetical protein n=1 Tax=Falsiroseomonas sp. TaxID=2870721 RepID=UPI003565A761